MQQEGDLIQLRSVKGFGTCTCGKSANISWKWLSGDRCFSACSQVCAERRVQNFKDCQLAWDKNWLFNKLTE